MRIKLNIDYEAFKAKPLQQYGLISWRLGQGKAVNEIEPHQLISIIESGRAFTPAFIDGERGKGNWESQQVIVADIDNDTGNKDERGKHIALERQLTPDAAITAMSKYNIQPYLMYYTYSNSDYNTRFRIVLVLDAPITDAEQSKDLTARFTAIFNEACAGCADSSMSDTERITLGGVNGCVFNKTEALTSIDTLKALPTVAQNDTPILTALTAPTIDFNSRVDKKTTDSKTGGKLSQITADFEHDKESFDLLGYVIRTTSGKVIRKGNKAFINPCPICGHNDSFNITGSKYHCFSDHDKTGGSIIDYLINAEHLSKADAISKFKFDIMGYDKASEAAAYKASMPQAQKTDKPQAAQQAQQTDFTALPTQNSPKIDNIADYINQRLASEINDFNADAERLTGFKALDGITGGIYTGLYTIGGVSSVGKTTFIHQLGEQLAAAGSHVIYFSLEQSKLEMITKSIARQTAKADINKAFTAMQIRKGSTNTAIKTATEAYIKAVGDRFSVVQCDFTWTPNKIRAYTEQYERLNHVKPVIIIDYLQVLQADKDEATGKKPTDAKAITDSNVIALKRLSRDIKTPVFIVSSVNRSNYLAPIDFEAFKESGIIEYTSDVVLGLQLSVMNDELFNKPNSIKEKREAVRTAKASMPRSIELVCLKNRYGISNFSCGFTYYPQYDLYLDATEWQPAAQNPFEDNHTDKRR